MWKIGYDELIIKEEVYSDSSSSSNTSDEESEQEVSNISWNSIPFKPEILKFDKYETGITSNITLDTKSLESDCFQHFLGEEIVGKLAEFTNAQYHSYVSGCDMQVHPRLQSWRDVTVAEMYLFLAVTFLFTRNKRLDIHEYWSTDLLLQSTIYPKTMSRDRYKTILRFLSFSAPNTVSSNFLQDILPILEHVKKTFKSSFTPHRDLCLDESVLPFKGLDCNKQQNSNKKTTFGIKLFMLRDAKTRYIIDFIIYCGERTPIMGNAENLGVTGDVATTLLQDFMKTSRRLYVDNWYSSPKLFSYLYNQQIYACGPIIFNRLRKAGISKFKPLERGEIDARYSEPLVAVKYRNRRDIHMLSTFHSADFVSTKKCNRKTGLPKMKPEIIIDYDKNKSTEDNADLMLHSIPCIRKTKMWQRKLGLHLIDLCMLNAHTFYQISQGTKKNLADFQLCVIRQLIEKYLLAELQNPIPSTSNSIDALRLTALHLVDHMPEYTEGKKSRSCFVCQHTKLRKRCRKESRFMCKECGVTLCVNPCFKIYHKDKEF